MRFAFHLGILLLVGNLKSVAPSDDDTLVALQLLIRHGNRTALSIFDEYRDWYIQTFQPFEFGQITPHGRRQSFNTGAYLRQRYDHFLPEEFFYSDVQVRCTGMQRIMEASAVTMAAMFPPREYQRWQDSGVGDLYTPIPCEYPPQSEDIVLQPDSVDCPRFSQRLDGVMDTPEYQRQYNALTQYGEISRYAAAALNFTEPLNPQQMGTLWDNLRALDSNGLPLPSWSTMLYPEPLNSIVQLNLTMRFSDPEMIRFGAGEFFNEILSTATRFEQDPPDASLRRVYAYIGHDNTFVPVLIGLGFERNPPIISYGAALIMELHRNRTTSEIGYKFLYRNETWSEPITYTVPGCQEICPLAFVQNRLQPYIPTRPFMEYC